MLILAPTTFVSTSEDFLFQTIFDGSFIALLVKLSPRARFTLGTLFTAPQDKGNVGSGDEISSRPRALGVRMTCRPRFFSVISSGCAKVNTFFRVHVTAGI